MEAPFRRDAEVSQTAAGSVSDLIHECVIANGSLDNDHLSVGPRPVSRGLPVDVDWK